MDGGAAYLRELGSDVDAIIARADTLAELHAMALAIGMKPEWFQTPPQASSPHYDLTPSRLVNEHVPCRATHAAAGVGDFAS